MSDVIPALSPMPILKMEGGGVMPMNQTSVIHQPVCFPQNSIITSHPTQHLHLLHPQETPSPIHAVPSLVNDDIAEVENTHSPEVQCTTNQVRSIESSDRQVTNLSVDRAPRYSPRTVLSVETEPRENTTGPPPATAVRDSSGGASGRSTPTAAGSPGAAPWTRIKGTSVATVG